jgi:dCMP deaminase
MRFAPGNRNTAQSSKMDDGVWNMFLEGPLDHHGLGDVDFTICTPGIVTGPAKPSHEPSSHEPGRAGDKDPHGRRLPDCGSNGNAMRRTRTYLTRPLAIGDHVAMIIGVAGRNGAGKGEFVKFLEARSFTVLSLSEVIRQELADRGLSETRERMIDVGQEMRRQFGPGALAQRLVRQLQPDRNYAIDSIRHPVEVEILRHSGQDFHLVWIDAKLETRFERLQARGRPGDPQSVAELESLEARERGSDDPNAQQLDQVQDEASFTLSNDGALESFQSQIESWVRNNLAFSRPGWDEYFMDIARTVASRSNCVKRKVAAVVTRDRRIISTGYNGTPRGTTNCNEGGCPRCNDLAPGGTRLDECVCSHAEENAITQAAYHGVSLKGGTVYTTFSPCLQCTKMIINAGLAEVVFQSEYPLGQVSFDLLAEAGIKLRQLDAG